MVWKLMKVTIATVLTTAFIAGVWIAITYYRATRSSGIAQVAVGVSEIGMLCFAAFLLLSFAFYWRKL